ncbi:MAG TPA: Nif3-like dinuclear metal center hexameric protein, partial [Candidatus Egerieisoma faecipullorum]|nr:Nif3-like dinuclear metal center hexameric protein [Candidatus Egerieisoma faecipullorum]
MKVKEIIELIEREIAPIALAADWDVPGLKTGSRETEVSKILVCLDVTSAVIAEAVKKGCNMIVSHHPLIFHPLSAVTEDTEPALCAAIREGIAVYAAHTNLDFAEGGINDALAQCAGLLSIKKDDTGRHRYGKLSGLVPLEEFAADLKERLGVSYLQAIIPKACEQDFLVERVGVSCGAFDRETDWIYAHKIDLLLTGEIKHAEAVALAEETFITLGAGHYFTEICGVRAFAQRL